ncbi:ABC transporter ATP-binding protein [Tepidimicrobium xylanilyticum]|uniref:Peptide/nickel transport system ATP-binding protein n=1 Tax=Tepidimicrobium xylanilyticum TaxID=1123352 RepID=A0A1H3DE05_9FIRM|nr:ABC transporter ATP-binding protein [Tepidimicrobium xylanilyticum]GMG97378.1 oligopeptide ABC transporter ATP-binding protein [Tepidimicrobium xylanilyticum]SDX64683.1 peptide/nickel transport system ATP-binding protein [Tepidimicrobium xylanilyticum]
MSSLLEIKDLTKYYVKKKAKNISRNKKKRQIIKAVDGVSFSLESGKVMGIIGESGCGKSTLGRLLIALEEPTSGIVKFQGKSISSRIKEDRLKFRRDCQMIFQNPFDTFDPRNNIKRILTSALKIHNIGSSKEERLDICIKYMENAGVIPAKDYLNRYPHELSGGQLQRISIIRSMLLNPKLIIADEPVSMLDVSVRADIINLLLEITEKQKAGLIFISHDIATTSYISDSIAVMYLGRIVEIGRTYDIINNSKHPYTKVLISNCMSIDPFENSKVIKIKGEPVTPMDAGEGCYFAPRCYKVSEKCKESYPPMIKVGEGHYASCFYLFDGESYLFTQ